MLKFREFGQVFKDAFQGFRDDKTTWYAAALSYYTVLSLAPLLLIAIAVAGTFFGEQAARGEIVEQVSNLIGTEGAQVIQTAIENADSPGGGSLVASVVSITVLLWGASRVFAQLQDALNTIWGVEKKPEKGVVMTFARKRLLSFSMVLGIGFLLLVSLLVSALLNGLTKFMSGFLPGTDFLWMILNNAVSLGVITLLFAMIYKYLPDVRIAWGHVMVGALMTSLLFTLGKFAIGFYLGRSSFGSVYGAAGSLVVLLVWVYFSALIFFFGAEFTQAYTRRTGSAIVPDRHAVKVKRE